MKTQVIIPSAGIGSRLKTATLKPLIVLDGKPIFIHCLEAFEACSLIHSIIVVVSSESIEDFKVAIKENGLKKVKAIVPGGSERCDSVQNGLKQVDDDADVVLVHDGARPFVSVDLIERCIKALKENEAAIAAVAVKPTIKLVDAERMIIEKTLDRTKLWDAQTPQAFKKDIIVKAYSHMLQENPTDDSSLVERMGVKVKIVEGSYDNIKITTPEDLKLAEILVKTRGKE
ncbi:MAG: 2-C-methyl-D-erythritol 4-phosphate cytidylyltransferase [Candidatus Omnitrophica bacterium]|nr:2-C-methyl-D-erythritol 4-phosphate cytidylyltransferase [Candidatus Omnitrophota bacterium]